MVAVVFEVSALEEHEGEDGGLGAE
jgi:hypothetical protein